MRTVLILFSLLFYTLSVDSQSTISSKMFRTHESKAWVEVKSPKLFGKEYVVTINTQKEFDSIQQKVYKAIKSNYTNIIVKIGPGVFFYRNNHFNLNGINNSQLSIRVEGNGTKLVAAGNDYTTSLNHFNGDVDYGHIFLTDNLDYLDFDGGYSQLQSLVEVVNEKSKLCRIKTDLPSQDASGASIQLNEWYMVRTYPIIKIKGGFVYFVASDLKYDKAKKCFNTNYDYGVSKILPRYLIKNLKGSSPFSICKGRINFPQGVNAIHECCNSQFLVLYKNDINYFHLKGIEFVGSSEKDQLIYIRRVNAKKVLITDCAFRYINSVILRCDYADNVCFTNNIVENCFGKGVWSRNDCNHTTITDNHFYRTVKTIDQSACISCISENFYVANNVFRDFGGMAIATGLKYTQKQVAPISGIIENNEIFYSQDYHDFMKKNSLIDGAAIYLSTQNDETIIRYNYIHGYTGIHSRRSIYCDDGCYNAKIYGNIIEQPDNGNAVFAWFSKGSPKSNTGISFMYNVILGKYKLEERPNSDCVHGKNIIIYSDVQPQNVLKNFANQEDDIFVKEPILKEGIENISNTSLNAIRNLPTYEGMKKWLK